MKKLRIEDKVRITGPLYGRDKLGFGMWNISDLTENCGIAEICKDKVGLQKHKKFVFLCFRDCS